MVTVRPLRGLRPRSDLAARVASPPYDVLTRAEARELALQNPDSFLRVNKAEVDFDDGVDPYGPEVYARGKENLERLIARGVMVRDPEPCFYLYRLTWRGAGQTGLVALTSVDEYDSGLIKKHEHTRPEKVRDRANHIEVLEAQVGPVFSAFRQIPVMTRLFAELTSGSPRTAFLADDGVRHEIWVVRDQEGREAIEEAFASLECLYIADGHHRSQSAAEVCRRFRVRNPGYTGEEPPNFFLNVLFGDDELRILPYNRVVKEIGGMSLESLLERAAAAFEITPAAGPVEPARAHEFGLYAAGHWFRLEARDGSFDPAHPTESLDASILARNFLEPLLGITDPRTDNRIGFVGGIRGTGELERLVGSGRFAAAFSLHPTSMAQLFAVADSGEVMPPKSTWFEPKLRSGMVVNLLAD